MNTISRILEHLSTIKGDSGQSTICDRLISAGKAIESAPEMLSPQSRVTLGEEFQRLTNVLAGHHPTRVDPVPLLTLVSTIPMTVNNAFKIANQVYAISGPGQEQTVSQLVHAMVENLKRHRTIEHEMGLRQAENPRFAGDLSFQISEFENDLISIPYELASMEGDENHLKPYLDFIFSLDIKSNDASMDPKPHAIVAVLEAGRDGEANAAPAWPAMKRWLDENQALVTQRMLASGWHKEFKPKLYQKAEMLGLPWLKAVLVKRGFRFDLEDLVELQLKHQQAPDKGTYDTSLLGPDGKPAPADSKTLIAMLSHAMVYDNLMPDDWITHHNDSAVKLLHTAFGVVKSLGLEPDPERLKSLFELSIRKLRLDNDIDWLVKSEFKHLLNSSLGYRAVKFTQELGC